MVMWIMSDRTIPRSFRFMEGFGVHTFRFVNAEGKSTFVKFHWKPKLGLQSVVWNEAVKINGADPDFHRRDLWNAIQMGDYPEWELGLQLFDEEFAEQFRLRCARCHQAHPGGGRPHSACRAPRARSLCGQFLRRDRAGRLLHPEHRAGLDFTNDPLLQGATSRTSIRSSSGSAVQTSRISGQCAQVPLRIIFSKTGTWPWSIRKAGSTMSRIPGAATPGGPRESPEKGFHSYPAEEEGPKLRIRSETFADHYSQARQFYLSQTEIEQPAYRRGAHLRTEQGGNAGNPHPYRRASAEYRSGFGRPSGGRLAPQGDATSRQTPRRPTQQHLQPSPALSILLNGPTQFHRDARSGYSSRMGCILTSCTRSQRLWKRKERSWRSSRRRSAGSRPAMGRGSTRRSNCQAPPRSSMMRWHCCPLQGVEMLMQEPASARFRRRCLCPWQIHRLRGSSAAALREGWRIGQSRRRVHRAGRTGRLCGFRSDMSSVALLGA